MIIVRYETKKAKKEAIGKKLRYTETSLFGDEVKNNGIEKLCGCNRPHLTGYKREFFATVTLNNGIIEKVT